jgi:polar amino acid transport system permease protein
MAKVEIAPLLPYFFQSALSTVEISALALLLGLVVASLAASAKLSAIRPVRALGQVYVSVMRGTPCLIQLFVLYFGGPQVGIELEPFAAGVIGLGLNIGAYMAEGIRGAIMAVDRGQNEAARTLGFSQWQTMRRVILPQAARLMIRPLGVNTVALIKGSALVSTISVAELTFTAQRFISTTYRPIEMCAIAGAFYMVMVFGVLRIVGALDARFVQK